MAEDILKHLYNACDPDVPASTTLLLHEKK